VAGEPQPQIDIQKAVSRLFFFFFSFDKTTELGLDAEGLTETILHLNLGFFCFALFCFCFFPYDETMTELLLRQQHQDWGLKDKHQNY
jgi:hypothetical protein